MDSQIINELNIIKAKHHSRNVWLKLLGVFSAIVIFVTTYMLIMPAITLSGVLVCGQSEHTHSTECYVRESYISCEISESNAHIHTEDCYSVKETLICDTPEHTHMLSCYKDESLAKAVARRRANSGAGAQSATCPQDETLVASGELSSDVFWAVTEDSFGTRTLTIYGNGPMPNFKASQQPYNDYMTKQNPATTKLVVADGITRIGQYSFNNCKFTDIQIGSTVESIESCAFASASCAGTTLVIPGNVKEIKYAFPWGNWNKIILEEGVERISEHGLQEVGIKDNESFYIPASVKSFEPGSPGILNFEVAEDSDYFYEIDGVLYSKVDDGLVAFPRERTGSYTISDSCTKIYPNAFFGCMLSELYVPSSVTYPIQTQTFKGSRLSKIHFSEGNTIASNAADVFDLCYYLTEIDAPDSFWPEKLGSQLMRSNNSIQEIYIGTQVKSIGSAMLQGAKSIKDVYYNAEDCTTIPKVLYEYTYGADASPRYTLTIGKDVDVLNGTTYRDSTVLQWGFKSFLYRADKVVFEGPNFIHVNDDVFSECDEPLKNLDNKDIYIDQYGAVYVLNSDGTASLVYVSPTATEITVPASITDESGNTYTVNKVGEYSCSKAENLTNITFASPGNITEISSSAFYGATELTQINGEHYYADVDALFTNATLGYNRYSRTALENNPDNPVTIPGDPTGGTETQADLWVAIGSSEDAKLYVTTDKFDLLTGANAATTITISNPDSSVMANKIFRIYFHSDSEGIVSDKTQDFTLKNEGEATGIPVKVVQTDVPGTYYFEIYGYQMGSRTLSTTVGHTFPSPDTDGGSLYIWIETYEVNGVSNAEFPAWVADESNWPQGNVKEDLSDAIYQKVTWSTLEREPTIEKIGNSGSVSASSIPGIAQFGSLKYTAKLGFENRDVANGEESYGLDIIKYIVYTDTLELNNGFYLNPDVANAINSGNYGSVYNNQSGYQLKVYAIVDGKSVDVVTIALPSTRTFVLTKAELAVDDDGNLVTQFRYNHNNSKGTNGKLAEIPTVDATLTFGNDIILINNSDVAPSTYYSITNNIEVDPVYTYTKEKHIAQDNATVTSRTGTADINFKAVRNNTISYFGDSDVVTISLNNPTPFDYPNAERITLPLPDAYYIKPDNIEKMFNENGDDILILTINNASFTDYYGELVTTTEGTEIIRVSPDDTITDGNPFTITTSQRDDIGSITLTKENGQIKMTVTKTGGEPAVYTIGDPGYETVKDALTSVGYYVTAESSYSVVYNYGNVTLPGGFNEQYQVYITAKDSFKLLGSDYPSKYISETYNAANINPFFNKHRDDGNYVWGTSTKNYGLNNFSVKREIVLEESLKIGGDEFTDGGQVSDGSVLDYQMVILHNGKGVYDTLPVVKALSGAQVLLVPCADNANASWATADTIIEYIDGEPYYVLNEPGTYNGVWIDGCYADEVTVTDAGASGLKTVIKWYFDDKGGNFRQYINVKSMCSNSYSGCEEATFSVGSMAWLNDHDGQRLYVSHNGGGSIFYFDKNIVEEKGTSPYQDVLNADKKSIVFKNNVVTYRLEIENRGNNQTSSIIRGSDIFDQLPNNKNIFSWGSAQNPVTITYFCEGNVTVSDESENGWSIEDVPNLHYDSKTGIQYIVWDNDFSIEFPEGSVNKTCYIYVTLAFPSDDAEWEDYVIANNGADVYNIFYLYNMPANVIHEVADTGKVLLQKGVTNIATRLADSNGNYSESSNGVKHHDTRTIYENTDNNVKVITYYTVVANTSRIKLYLNDIYDSLPVGFEYQGLSFCTEINWGESNFYKNTYQSNIETTFSNRTKLATLSNSQNDSYKYNYINCNIAVDKGAVTDGERQLLKFTLSGGNLKYDEAMGQYYLDPGEAVRFGYMVTTGTYESNEGDVATNYVAMPYTDYLGSGVNVDKDTDVHVANVPGVSDQPEANDGTREIWENGYCESLGFDDENAFTQWIGSSVAVERGQIIPGITKQVVSVTNTSGNTSEYTGMTNPTNTVNWQVKLYNDGNNAINDYVFTDTMEYPYRFTGKFNITVYNGSTVKTTSTATNTFGDGVFAFIRNDDGSIQVRVNRQQSGPYGNGVYDIQYGVPLKLTGGVYVNCVSVGDVQIKPTILLEQVETGKTAPDGEPIYNEKLTVYFEDASGGNLYYLAPDGTAVIDFSTKSFSTDYTNTSYVNHAEFIPLKQDFDGRYVSRGSDDYTSVTPFDGQYHMVKNSAVININDGYATSATKSITETLEPTNTTTDLAVNNWILINNEDREFTYGLSVNSPETIVEYIEIIDNLPFVGDTKAYADSSERGSEFQVKLSSTPDFKVKVTSKDGTEKWLTSSQFVVDYSTKNANFSMDDKQHISSWTATAGEARSVRIYIPNISNDGTYLINKGETVTVYFDCNAEEGSQPGAIAWNNFGYTYKAAGSVLSAQTESVGVKFPGIPTIEKQLLDTNGNSYSADENETFTAVVFEVNNNSIDLSNKTPQQIDALLDSLNCKYTIVTLNVDKGNTVSETIAVKEMKCYDYDSVTDSFTETNEFFNWVHGNNYGFYELISENSNYTIHSYSNNGEKKSVFYYNETKKNFLTLYNTRKSADVILVKTDTDNEAIRLPDAVFALYSPCASDAMTSEEIAAAMAEYSLTASPNLTEQMGSTVYYLCDISATDESGLINYSLLIREEYLVSEIRAPEGYYINNEVKHLDTSTPFSQQSIVVEDRSGYELPSTGGEGVILLYTVGMFMFAAGAIMFSKNIYIKRKEENP